jgi:protein tyrosine/serine phosphatase
MSFEPRPPRDAGKPPVLNRLRPDEERYARRMARIARWDRPIESRGQRLRAWANMLLVDHGIFRLAYLNAHKVTPRLWRAAQPAPGQIAWFASQGVKTIVNLRGGREHGSWPLQREACERHGIALVDFVLRSRGAPERETILAAKDFFETLKEPALVHCKSGADRAGFFAALYLLIHEGRPLGEAMRQLSLRYGHFRFAKTGILDAFFELYRVEGEAKGIAFLDWARDIYDPEKLERSFKPGFFSSLLADRVIRRE